MVFYKLTLSSGEEVDSNIGKSAMEVKLGSGGVIPGFEAALKGMAIGESKTVVLQPREAYGERDASKVQKVEKDKVPEGVEVGMQLQAGEQVDTITEVTEEHVMVDFNHKLAGEELTFDITIDSIKEPGAPPTVDRAVDAAYTPPLGAPNSANPVVFMDIEVGSAALGRVEIELKNDVAPKTGM